MSGVLQSLLAIAHPLLIAAALVWLPPRGVALAVLALLAARFLIARAGRRAPSAGGEIARLSWSLGPAAAFVALFAGASAVSNRPFGLLLTPVAVNLALLGAFAWSLRRIPIVETLARLQVGTLAPAEVRYCRRVTWVWCGFFVANGGMGLLLALRGDLRLWTAYTGFFAYLAMGALFAGEYVYRHARFRRYVGGVFDPILMRLFPPRNLPERVRVEASGDPVRRAIALEVPTGLVCWAGHFPGQPMLPGVVALDWTLREIAAWRGSALRLAEIEGLKFRRPILPGDAIELELVALDPDAGAGGEAGHEDSGPTGKVSRVEFCLRRGSEEVAGGRFRFDVDAKAAVDEARSGSTGARAAAHGRAAADAGSWPEPAGLLLHREPMLWLDAVESHASNETRCHVSVDSLSAAVAPHRPDGQAGVGGHVAVEWMAQAVGAHAGLVRRSKGQAPCVGMLLGSKRVRLLRSVYNRGERFRVVVVHGWGGDGGAASFDCRVETIDGGALVAEARLSCFMPDAAAARGGVSSEASRFDVRSKAEVGFRAEAERLGAGSVVGVQS